MNIGDLVTVRNHPEHLGVITELSEEQTDSYGWTAIIWFNDDGALNEYKIPLSSAKHIEVIK